MMKNKKDDDINLSEYRQSMEGLGSIYESVFQQAMKLCIKMNLNDESQIAAKKIISYNPSNQELAETFPTFEKVANFVSHLILEKIHKLTSNDNHDDAKKKQKQNIKSTLINENEKEDQSNLIQNLNDDLNKNELNPNHQASQVEFSTRSIPWDILGDCYLVLGDFPNSFAALSQYFQINYHSSFDIQQKDVQSELSYPGSDVFFWFSFGIVNAHYKYHNNAISCFKNFLHILDFYTGIPLVVNNFEVPTQAISDFKNEDIFRMAISYRCIGQYKDSLELFQSITDRPPGTLQADDVLFQIAYTFQIMQEFSKSEDIYNEIYQRNQDNFNIIVQFGWMYISQYLAQNKKNESLYNEGVKLIKKAYQICETDPLVLFLIGKLKMIKEDYQVAYTYFKNCINYWTDCSSFWCDLGVLYYKNNQYPDALVAFQTALYISSELNDAWLNIGTIFEKMGQFQNAKKIYTTAKNMCKSQEKEAVFVERIHLLQNFENNKYVNIDHDIIFIQNDQDFIQLPLEFASNYIAAVPKILPAFIDVHDKPDINLEVLSSYPKSMF